MPPLPWSVGLRACAMLVVASWHVWLTPLSDQPSTWVARLTTPFGGLAHTAVLIFILLSGYLLGRHWRPAPLVAETRRYLIRRCWRLLPPYWAALALTMAAMLLLGLSEPAGTHWDTGLPMTWWRSAANALLLTDLAGIAPYNHPAWTVPVEFHLYLLAPLVVLFRRQRWALALGSSLTLLIAFLAPGFIAPFFVLSFTASFWIGLRRQQLTAIDGPAVLRLIGPVAGFAAVVAGVIWWAAGLSEGGDRFLLVDAIATPLVLAWLLAGDAGVPGSSHRLLTWAPLQWLGDRSYSIYLVHAVLIEVAWRFTVEPLGLTGEIAPLAVMAATGLASSFVVGDLLYRLVERPAARRAKAVGHDRRRRESV